ncbi:flagellar hook-associated protein FlgL [Demequina aestuarii]|uniref:flagellar hook-associated protein FlgL n=1 Tax=Demequina aestuarii TaxID=327095 RepID=UPI000783BC75|nr:flagellar hook-associated protein FlgL [Demequina aestuarii]
MISRVTQQTVQRSTLGNLQQNLRTMSDLQAKLSSGKTITKASDDPSAANRAMNLRADHAAATQARRNADDGVSWLAQIDTALQGAVSVLHRARELTVRGANTASVSGPAADAIATELVGLRDAMLDIANSSLNGRSLFAGTSADGVAFDDAASATPYAWHGTPGATVDRRIGPDALVRVDADGAAAFGAGATSVFQLFDDIAADLNAGVNVSGRLTELDDRLETMLTSLTDVGVRTKQLTDAQNSLTLRLQDTKSMLSGIEDIDLAHTILELQMQEVAYQGALGATARVLQPTLMDFLR